MSEGDMRSNPSRGSTRTATVRTVEPVPDRRDVTKKKVIERLKALAPSLLASGAILDGRPSSLEPPPPLRDSRKK